MAMTISNQQKMYLTTAAVLAFGVAAYGLGRVYPPLGPSAGTVAPAERYVNSQVGEADVTLGDTSVPELMQTDAFELITKDPQLRAFVSSAGFQALASQPQATPAARATNAAMLNAVWGHSKAVQALAGYPQAFAAVLANPAAFASL